MSSVTNDDIFSFYIYIYIYIYSFLTNDLLVLTLITQFLNIVLSCMKNWGNSYLPEKNTRNHLLTILLHSKLFYGYHKYFIDLTGSWWFQHATKLSANVNLEAPQYARRTIIRVSNPCSKWPSRKSMFFFLISGITKIYRILLWNYFLKCIIETLKYQ